MNVFPLSKMQVNLSSSLAVSLFLTCWLPVFCVKNNCLISWEQKPLRAFIKSDFPNTITGTQTTYNLSFRLKNGRFTKSSQKKKVINFKKPRSVCKESDYIAAENCGESRFQEGLS